MRYPLQALPHFIRTHSLLGVLGGLGGKNPNSTLQNASKTFTISKITCLRVVVGNSLKNACLVNTKTSKTPKSARNCPILSDRPTPKNLNPPSFPAGWFLPIGLPIPFDRQHPIQRNQRPFARLIIHLDLIHHLPLHQILQHPAQMRQIDPVHRRAQDTGNRSGR